MEAANVLTFLKFGIAKKSYYICVVFTKGHEWPWNCPPGAKLGGLCPPPRLKTATGRYSWNIGWPASNFLSKKESIFPQWLQSVRRYGDAAISNATILRFGTRRWWLQTKTFHLKLLRNRGRKTRGLQSATKSDQQVSRTRLEFEERAFSVAASKVWNDLPLHLRVITNTDTFKRRLKTHFSANFMTWSMILHVPM